MTSFQVKTSVLFDRNRELYNDPSVFNIINQGGTSSGKTVSIMQLLFDIATSTEGQLITIVGESIPNLKKGAYRDAENLCGWYPDYMNYITSWNRSDRIITFTSGTKIEFISCETEQSAKNGKRDILFVNEANGIVFPIFWQLAIRTRKKVFIDYNPSAPFWAHDELLDKVIHDTDADGNPIQITSKRIISDHRHNPFLSSLQHSEIENISDPQRHRVYARGLTGNVEGLIFPNWKIIPDKDFPEDEDNCGTGIDWGYTNDPTAIVKVARQGNRLYFKELVYEPGMPTPQIKQIIQDNGLITKPAYCDLDKELIAELRRMGVMAMPARKGAGSINAGIMKLKEMDCYYTASSTNIAFEKKRYSWETDKITGKPINVPQDNFNHTIDAIRYFCYTHYFK